MPTANTARQLRDYTVTTNRYNRNEIKVLQALAALDKALILTRDRPGIPSDVSNDEAVQVYLAEVNRVLAKASTTT